MALVGYSDSEGSDNEANPAPEVRRDGKSTKPIFEKVISSSGARKIKVDLPKLPTAGELDTERPSKRAKTNSGLSGFNAMLPAPKRVAEGVKKTGLGRGVSLKTSTNVAFSREPESATPANANYTEHSRREDSDTGKSYHGATRPEGEVRLVGNAMRFKPLSVANSKKAKKAVLPPAQVSQDEPKKTAAADVPAPRPKVSLFSVSQEDEASPENTGNGTYEPLFHQEDEENSAEVADHAVDPAPNPAPNSLDAVATDLNLSEADRRRLFGRQGQGAQAVTITNFDMDQEYDRNERLRAAGEAVEHRAVRAIAPGKHSLKQLVNAATSQQEALEDAWAQGKRNRGEAGNKYGWGR